MSQHFNVIIREFYVLPCQVTLILEIEAFNHNCIKLLKYYGGRVA